MQRPISDWNREHQATSVDRFRDFIDRELHPATAQAIGEIVGQAISREEFAMSVIVQMQLDPIRRQREGTVDV